jgi:hypothetical protein
MVQICGTLKRNEKMLGIGNEFLDTFGKNIKERKS